LPRRPRKKSITDTYHIMLRGINRQSIFEDDRDRRKFVRILESNREEVIGNDCVKIFEVYAWVIMGNHFHLVMRFLREDISMQLVMKRICVAYSYYYNHKNQRIGPVFQDRYRSEPIEDERYLFNVVRYVHMNPVKAGMCHNPIEYPWSSYSEYLQKKSVARIVERGVVFGETAILEMVGQNGITRVKGMSIERIAAFEKLTMEEDDGTYLEIGQEQKTTITDDEAREKMKEYGCTCIEEFNELGKAEKVRCVRSMIHKGAGVSQVSRITGITRTTIYKMAFAKEKVGK